MGTMENALNMLAEATTTELSKAHRPEDFSESQTIAHRGSSYTGQFDRISKTTPSVRSSHRRTPHSSMPLSLR